jgi:predicted TIM-barrel fold metal-dependent hydrolase
MLKRRPQTASQRIRASLGHPIVDADAHFREFPPLYLDYVHKVAGPDLGRRYAARFSKSVLGFDLKGGDLHGLSDPRDPERRAWRTPRGAWWGWPTWDAEDYVTTYLPKLLYQRLDDIGLDFTILYPGLGLALPHEPDQEIRLGTIRAHNTYFSEVTLEYADRMAFVAVIPMHSPAEAIAELEHAVGKLGAKVIMIPPGVKRPLPAVHARNPEYFPNVGWMDNFGLDSEHDYDPFWRRCVELKVAVTCHGGMVPNIPWNGQSLSNFNFNHIGNMAQQQHAFCKSVFMAGVTRRFPTLKFALLECGASWACLLYADIVGHWDKRNLKALAQFDPARLDRPRVMELFREYGGESLRPFLDRPEALLPPVSSYSDEQLDEFLALAVERPEDLKTLFAGSFHFGCEADDPTTAWAFSARNNPMGARLKAMLGSDLGHFDLPDLTGVLEEAWELVDHELISPEEFREFTFANAASMHLAMNPDFFKGTSIQSHVSKL